MNDMIHSDRPGLLRRIAAFPLTLLVIEAVVVVGVAGGYSVLARRLGVMDDGPLHFVGALGLALAVIGAFYGLTRWVERRDDPGFSLAGAPRELGLGLLAGTALF
ncbi:MAG TPA: hypothetical protein VFV30_03490, partial [Novosphingobium sp.]|nr:hypothetical protein [Novosphingobium sp.]